MKRALITFVLLPLSACAMFSRPPEIRDRYRSLTSRAMQRPVQAPAEASSDPDWALRYTATISSAEIPPSDKAIAVTALSDRGQAAYVAALGENAKDADALSTALAKPLKAGGAGSGRYVDRTHLERRFVIAILPQNGILAPGDRLAWARLRIVPLDRARFIGWSVAYNKRTSISVGSIKASQSATLKGETGLKIGGPLADTKVSAETTRALEESAAISDLSTIDALVTPDHAEVIQSAGWRDDLTGNATFDASFELPAVRPASMYVIGKLFADGKPRKSAEVALAHQSVDLPDDTKPVCARLELDYVVRHLAAGARSFSESDDVVELARGRFTSAPLPIAPVQRLPLYGLDSSAGFVQVVRPGVEEQLAVADLDALLGLIDWLNATGSPVLGDATLKVRDARTGRLRAVRRADVETMVATLVDGRPPPAGTLDPPC